MSAIKKDLKKLLSSQSWAEVKQKVEQKTNIDNKNAFENFLGQCFYDNLGLRLGFETSNVNATVFKNLK